MRVAVHADAVAHLIPGGVGAYVAGLLDELLASDDGNEYGVVLARSAGPLPSEWKRAREIRTALPLRPLYLAWNYLGLPLLGGDLDVVHATGLVIPPARGAALVATVHDLTVELFPQLVPGPWRRLYRRGLRRALAEAAVLCANSHATKQALLERYGLDHDRVVVTPLAPRITPATPRDPHALERLGIQGPYLLHVGTLEPRKNQTTLIRAFATVAGDLPGHLLVLAGAPGWGSGEALAEIERSDLGERIVVTGAVEAAGLAALYAGARAFAFPSLYEGFGIPLAEALSFGVPAVASHDPALREMAGDAALFVDPADLEGLSRALVAVASDEELRTRLAAAGPPAAARYRWSATADATREAYRRAASPESRTPPPPHPGTPSPPHARAFVKGKPIRRAGGGSR